MAKHRTFLLTWNPADASPEDLEVESAFTCHEGLRAPWSWAVDADSDLIEGSRVFLLKRGRGRRGIIASGWCAARSKGDSEAEIEFTMVLDWESGQIVPERLLEEKFPILDWHPDEGGAEVSVWAGELEDLWVDELYGHGLREAGKGHLGWFRSKLFAWYRKMAKG